LGEEIRKILQVDYVQSSVAIQQDRYKQAFRVKLDFSGIEIPPSQPGFDRLIIMQQGYGPNKYYEASERQFPCSREIEDLDNAVKGRNEREWNKTYAIWVRNRREADCELKNMSAVATKEKGIQTMTLAERLWLGIDWFLEKKEHLDEKNNTYCSGSRYFNGNVPSVALANRKLLRVSWNLPRAAYPWLRARAVVSLAECHS